MAKKKKYKKRLTIIGYYDMQIKTIIRNITNLWKRLKLHWLGSVGQDVSN